MNEKKNRTYEIIGIGVVATIEVIIIAAFVMGSIFTAHNTLAPTPSATPTYTPTPTPTATPTPTPTPIPKPSVPWYLPAEVTVSGTVSFGMHYGLPIYSICFKSRTTGVEYVADCNGIDSACYSISLPNCDSYDITTTSALGTTFYSTPLTIYTTEKTITANYMTGY